jgi:dihydroorotate dehydrogenase
MMARLTRSVLFGFEPETAHRLAVNALKYGLVGMHDAARDKRLAVIVAGMVLPNPIGVAAGFDKDGEVPWPLLKAGFGFTELGTLTPRPQAGNPRPRVFRLADDRAVINRLGFNNGGLEAASARFRRRRRHTGIIGVNVGANKDSKDRIGDYIQGYQRFRDRASYFTINISSPNTPGLRDLQTRDHLKDLLGRLAEAREQTSAHGERGYVPMLLKIAPDVAEDDLDGIVAEIKANGIDGMVVSNTTLSRDGLEADPGEAGGLSGRPLFERSTIMLAKLRKRAGPDMPLVGVGGVEDAATARTKIEAGADAVQLYTGMIYNGPGIAAAICDGLSAMLDEEGLETITAWRDTRVEEWAARSLV